MNTAKKNSPSLETKIGLYWLHKLGIASLVFGTVFLITYSIQLFGNPLLEAFMKLGAGVLMSITLLFLGEKMSKIENTKWYGHGLTAGGWSLAYFTAYAAHYIPDVKVISSLPVETVLLIAVAAGSLLSALRARSELMAIYSITLAAVTILMNGPSLFAVISFLIIAITSSVLGNLQAWRKLFAYALVSCYLGHFFCCFQQVPSLGDGIISTAFLFLMWLTFSIGIGFSASVPEKAKNSITTLACVNAVVFASGMAIFNRAELRNVNEILFVAAGVLYLAASRWLQLRKQEQLRTVHSLLGLFFVNAAKCMHFSGLTLLSIDVFQIALLAIVGMKYKIKPFQWVAVLLTLLFFPGWCYGAFSDVSHVAYGFQAFEYVRVGLLAAAALTGLAHVHIREQRDGYSYFYHIACNLMWSLVVLNFVESSWQAFGLALLAVANIAVSMIRNSDFHAIVGLIPLTAAVGIVGLHRESWLSLPISLMTAVLFAGHIFGRLRLTEEKVARVRGTKWLTSYFATREERAEYVEAAYWLLAYIGTILLTALVFIKVPVEFISLALGIEGLALLCAGFLLKESFFRASGLVVLAMLTGKLLFVDLAHHNTIERILSFIAAGVVFLLSSYAYTKFVDAPTDSANDNEDEETDLSNQVAQEVPAP